MMRSTALEQLNAELFAFPSRASGEELYEKISRLARRIEVADREQLVSALFAWLKSRSEPKTMLALQIASDLRIVEVRSEIESLLKDVQIGRSFLPYYAKPIEAALRRIGRCGSDE